jgi:hypothetical protein
VNAAIRAGLALLQLVAMAFILAPLSTTHLLVALLLLGGVGVSWYEFGHADGSRDAEERRGPRSRHLG